MTFVGLCILHPAEEIWESIVKHKYMINYTKCNCMMFNSANTIICRLILGFLQFSLY